MKNQLLLLEDIANVGRKGDLVRVKPGFARNFLVPQQKAMVADRSVIKIQARLKEERAKQAIEDKKEAEVLRDKLEHLVVTYEVKVDPDGHMYGSVTAKHIVDLLAENGIPIEKRMVSIDHSIKKVGAYNIKLKLKEGVEAHFNLKIEADEESSTAMAAQAKREKKAQKSEEKAPDQQIDESEEQ